MVEMETVAKQKVVLEVVAQEAVLMELEEAVDILVVLVVGEVVGVVISHPLNPPDMKSANMVLMMSEVRLHSASVALTDSNLPVHITSTAVAPFSRVYSFTAYVSASATTAHPPSVSSSNTSAKPNSSTLAHFTSSKSVPSNASHEAIS